MAIYDTPHYFAADGRLAVSLSEDEGRLAVVDTDEVPNIFIEFDLAEARQLIDMLINAVVDVAVAKATQDDEA